MASLLGGCLQLSVVLLSASVTASIFILEASSSKDLKPLESGLSEIAVSPMTVLFGTSNRVWMV
jgi:hypothetical protein